MRALTLRLAALAAAMSLMLGLAGSAWGDDPPKDQSAGEAKTKFPDNWYFNPRPDEYVAMEGKPAPMLAMAEFINGEGFTNEDLKGKITVVDLWATWCGPCVAAIPKNNMIAKKYADQGVTVVGVCTSRNGQEKLAESVKQHKIEYLVAKDPGEKTAKAWNVKFYPTYALVDRNGTVRAMGLMPDKVEGALKMLLKEQPASADAEAEQAAGEEAKKEGGEQGKQEGN